MRLSIVSFTKQGTQLSLRLVKRFLELGEDCRGYADSRFAGACEAHPSIIPLEESLPAWTKARFSDSDALIFIGAVGIAVRAIAPFLSDKLTDPAVVCVDEDGRFAISLLSGHVGGANDLARITAGILGAEPVVTTASDVRGLTAIDVWAKRRGLSLSDRELAKETAAAVLNGDPVGFYSDYSINGPLPDGMEAGACGMESGQREICARNVWVTVCAEPMPGHPISPTFPDSSHVLRLIPKILTVGIGCRKGTAAETIRQAVEQVFLEANLDVRAIRQIASIDLKKDEAGIIETAAVFHVPFVTYPAKLLEELDGPFTASDFVRQVTGTDNVCERAAAAAVGTDGSLLVKKQALNGVTVAVAERRQMIQG